MAMVDSLLNGGEAGRKMARRVSVWPCWPPYRVSLRGFTVLFYIYKSTYSGNVAKMAMLATLPCRVATLRARLPTFGESSSPTNELNFSVCRVLLGRTSPLPTPHLGKREDKSRERTGLQDAAAWRARHLCGLRLGRFGR